MPGALQIVFFPAVLSLALCPAAVAGDAWSLEARTRLSLTATTPTDAELACIPAGQCLGGDLWHTLMAESRRPGLPGLSAQLGLRYRFTPSTLPLAAPAGTYGSAGDLKVLSATLRWSGLRDRVRLEAGRLTRWDTDPLLYDGAALTLRTAGSSAWQRLNLSLYGGLWAALDADSRAEALYGALFPQADGGRFDLVDDIAVGGVALRWTPTWYTALEVADTVFAGTHYGLVAARWQPRSGLTLSARTRTLDLTIRDLELQADLIRLPSGPIGLLRYQRVFRSDLAFSPWEAAIDAAGIRRLLIGTLRPYQRLEAEGQHPFYRTLTLSLRGAATRLDAGERQDAFQRDLYELGGGGRVSSRCRGYTEASI